MDNEPLFKAIVAAMVFLDTSDDDEVDPHLAVRCLEDMSYELLKLAEADRKEFLELVESVAKHEADGRHAQFIREIPRMIGMVE
jgi:hypothetical protein